MNDSEDQIHDRAVQPDPAAAADTEGPVQEDRMSEFDAAQWSVLFPYSGDPDGYDYSEYNGMYSIVDGSKVDDITPDRIAGVVGFDVSPEGSWAEQDIVLMVELTDGTFATCVAWCDTTGWGCQSDVAWRWAPTREMAIEQGLDREARRRLGLSLPIDAVTSGEVTP